QCVLFFLKLENFTIFELLILTHTFHRRALIFKKEELWCFYGLANLIKMLLKIAR
ncbi:MAG: hypothetical protein ACI920_003367, partial [Saprospiraceae bacterium]